MENEQEIELIGARVHNLKNISLKIPRNSLTVVTGLSGSGKSSLAFDTIFAEGQRRYIETFSAYARHFLGNMERPDVDSIKGLSPVISIEQKTTNKNPRSTVGTTTEIYDFLRLLFARVGEPYSYETGARMVKYTEQQIVEMIEAKYEAKDIVLLAPLVRSRKGHYKELFERIGRKGFTRVRVDGEMKRIIHGMKVDRYKIHDIEVVIDRMVVGETDGKRLRDSVATAMKEGEGSLVVYEEAKDDLSFYSKNLMCPDSGISYSEPAPHSFSFNSPRGACPQCKGLGTMNHVDIEKVIPNRKISIHAGAIESLGKYKDSLMFWQLEALGERFGFSLKTPVKDISEEGLHAILYGVEDRLTLKNTPLGKQAGYTLTFDGVIQFIMTQQENMSSLKAKKWSEQFIVNKKCSSCGGMRLNKEALCYKLGGKNIAELANLELNELSQWIKNIHTKLSAKQMEIAFEIVKEINSRLGFLLNVGLDYLSLNRSSRSLSGGESQRIRLATQIGSQLVNVLYILDEPSIGLHQRDNERLIKSLCNLRDNGNTIIVVEHDKDMIMAADYVIDMGPKAGRHGGEVVAEGTPQDLLTQHSLTCQYLTGERMIEVPKERRKLNTKHCITIQGASGHNLKNVSTHIPLGGFICVTGVSGSGKSSLINQTLYPAVRQLLYNSVQDPLPHKKVKGLELVDKVIDIDQSPLGRTPRSNPATYTGVFSDIRSIFQHLPEAKIRGYKAGRFSFNVKGGRCETCMGNGYRVIEMNFLPDVMVPCEQCYGKRYNRETLEVRYKGKSIADVLDLTINQAVEFFAHIPAIAIKLKTLQDVGLGYLHLGQSSTTLSGGESQRVKLAAELAKRDTGKTLYILDEPTTGLHFEDIRVLLKVLNKLVDRGNTVLVIEHNLDVIKTADYLIDMGPDGGRKGGQIITEGSPEEVIQCKESHTAVFLQKELQGQKL